MSDLDGLEEVFEQTKIRVDKRTRRGNLGWAIPPNIERASAAREGKAIERPAALTPAARLDEDERITFDSTEGGPPRLIISEPVTSYTELMAGIRARVGQLGVRYLDFDVLACFPAGLSGKVFGQSQVKRLGPEKMFDAIRAAGLRLRIEEDPEQTRRIEIQITKNFAPRNENQARPGNHSHLSNKMIDGVLSYLVNSKGGLARLNEAVKEARSNWARHAAKALWEKRRGRGTGDFAAYLGNISLISNVPALRSPEDPGSSAPNACSAKANAA